MKESILLDTGVIVAYYSKDASSEVVETMEKIKSGRLAGKVMRPILVEALAHLCKLPGGIQFAETTIASFLAEFPIEIIPIDDSIMYKAGVLKCKYRKYLSMVDCVALAYALNEGLAFHTTEKGLEEIIHGIKVKKYSFT